MRSKFSLLTACLLLPLLPATVFSQTPCPFNSTDSITLARCLLRPVRRGGNLGLPLATLPAPLNALIGQPMNIDVARLREHLRARGIDEVTLGGAFVFRQGQFVQDLTRTRFFVIHDTSSPEITAAEFPVNINEPSWSGNNLRTWLRAPVPTHVFVNRVGESATKANFSQNVRGTKFERGRDAPPGTERQRRIRERTGQFLHIELIQPRRKSRPDTFFDLAPTPGMTQRQLDRLALLYVVASVRAGRWLIPAFHCAVDTPIPDAHDDPQNFDMDIWLGSLRSLLTQLE